MFLGGLAACLFAQSEERSSETRRFPSVREIVVDNVNGFIEVTGVNSPDAEVQIEKTIRAESGDRLALAKKEVTLDVTQEGGLVRLYVDGPFRCHCGDGSFINFRGWNYYGYKVVYDFKLRVPAGATLELRAVNDAHIKVENTTGDFRINNVNGGIELLEVSGSGRVHTVNGPVKVLFAKNPAGPVSFKSVNGTLDAGFQPKLSADVRLKSWHGGFYTDFDVTALPPEATPAPERYGTKFVYRGNRFTGVRIGAGGPELRFETLNGNVYIKKRGT